MTSADVTAYVGRWQPSSVSAEAAAFARDVITTVRPGGQERAKNLLWAAGKLADWAIGLGWRRYRRWCCTRRWPSGSPGARRAVAGGAADAAHEPAVHRPGVVPQLYPADLPLPRERAKAPYGPAQIDGYLALADTQPASGGCGRRGWSAWARAPG